MNLEQARDQMISQQLRTWDILDDRVLAVMKEVPRERFLPEAYEGLAFADTSLSLIHISEPTRPTRASRMPSSA